MGGGVPKIRGIQGLSRVFIEGYMRFRDFPKLRGPFWGVPIRRTPACFGKLPYRVYGSGWE